MEQNSQKLAMVTGASRGLGCALAEALAARGYHIIALARTSGALEALDDRIQQAGGSATLAPLDITNNDALAQICHAIHQRWGRLDLLVHAAIHSAPLTPVSHIAQADLEKSIASNITGTTQIITNTEPLLKAASDAQAVFFNDPVKSRNFHVTYGLTKAAQMRIARTWQAESAKAGPKVHILTPAPMPTALRGRFYPGEDRGKLTSCAAEAERLLAELQDMPGAGDQRP